MSTFRQRVEVCPPTCGIRTSADTPSPWRRAIDRAEAQGGAISFAQLRVCALSEGAILRRRRRGDLHPWHIGVYALGRPRLSPYGQAWAASLAAGARGALARWTAAAAVGAASWPQRPDLLVVGGDLRLEGVRVRRARSLAEDEIASDAAGLRLTAWPRTVTDLAASSSVAELQMVLEGLARRGLLDVAVLHAAIVRANGRGGLRKLRRALEPFETIPEGEYLSLLERFAALLLSATGIPTFDVNRTIVLGDGRPIRPDFYFRDAKLVVEVDGRASHDRAVQFSIDRERDRELQKLGYRVIRFTWQDIRYRSRRALRDIRAFV
jgi:very-short-patch-repair endonuclease